LLQSIRRYIPNIPKEHDEFEFETDELPISRGKWVVISEDAWDAVVPLIQKIKVLSSVCHQSREEVSAPQTTPGGTSVKRRREEEDSDPYHVVIWGSSGPLRVLCSPSTKVRHLKAKVKEHYGTPEEEQNLIYDGGRMPDDSTLASYDIQSGAAIDFFPILRGGKPVIYLYSPNATRISTKLSLVPEWGFSAIYPVVHAKTTPRGQELEWVVDASPNGTLKEVETGLEVSYLYWEAE
jgi:hypothetical protein